MQKSIARDPAVSWDPGVKGKNACKANALLIDSLCRSAETVIVLSGRQACLSSCACMQQLSYGKQTLQLLQEL